MVSTSESRSRARGFDWGRFASRSYVREPSVELHIFYRIKIRLRLY